MRITNPRADVREGLAWVKATVEWEDIARQPEETAYAVPEAFGHDLLPRAESFLLVGALAAMRLGEARVAFDGEACPQLHEGLYTAMQILASWDRRRRPVRLDVEKGCAHTSRREARQAAALLSGGVDSLALLRANALAYPVDHPSRIRTAFVYRGVWAPDPPGDRRVRERLEAAVEALEPVTRDLDLTLIPVYTNFRELTDWDIPFWQFAYQGAALASVAHLFADRIHTMSIGGTWDIAHLGRWGSHPLLDSNYGTHDVAVRHEQAALSRMDKTRLIADWPAGLEALRVCNRLPEATANCGRCEKCVRTMLTLAALDVLPQAKGFQADEVTQDDIAGVRLPYRAVEPDYREIADELRRAGRVDLDDAVRRCVLRSRLSRGRQGFRRLRRQAFRAARRLPGGASALATSAPETPAAQGGRHRRVRGTDDAR